MGGGLFALFGVVFVLVAAVQAIYHFRNATGKNRYSAFDVTDSSEESDPLNDRFGPGRENAASGEAQGESAFCPYCGAQAEGDYAFCRKCGKKLP